MRKSGFDRMMEGWVRDVRLALLIVGLLGLFRVVLLGMYYQEGAIGAGMDDYGKAFMRGFLFDARVGLMFAVGTFVMGMLIGWMQKGARVLDGVREGVGVVGVVVTVLLGVVNVGFFGEYHDQFNHWVLGLVHDDQWAIFASIWEQYPVVWVFIAAGLVLYLSVRGWLRFVRSEVRVSLGRGLLVRGVVVVIFVVMMGIGLRGSVQSRPLQRDDLAVTGNEFLNKIVNNPYFALYYTYSDYKHVHRAGGLKVFREDEDVMGALVGVYGKGYGEGGNLDEWLRKEKEGRAKLGKRPRHIFLVVLESQDSWPFLGEYEFLGLVPNMKGLAKEGVHVKRFVSAGTTTRTSLNAMISGLGDAGVYTHLQANSLKTYPMAMGKVMGDLGYKTRLFYGGHLSWQRLGDFAKRQGFKEAYGQEHMASSVRVKSWGVLDEDLFDFILKTVEEAGDEPSFNLVMTTSNHSPYPVDLGELGCPLFEDSSLSERVGGESVTSCQIMGHQWYNDYCVGKFVKGLGAESLCLLTGDHTSRRFYKGKVSLYEEKSVPLIMCGMPELKRLTLPEGVAGSHLDIVPTLVDMVAEPGFEYYTIGESLFKQGKDYGLGADIVITGDDIGWVGKGAPMEGRYNDVHAISWWRIMVGKKL